VLRITTALRVTMALTLALRAVLTAQVMPSNTPNAGNNGGSTNGNGGNNSAAARATPAPDPVKPTYLSGTVLVTDGNLPAEGVAVQRVCGVSVVAETHTDSQGRFTIQMGGNRGLIADASSGSGLGADANAGGGGRGSATAASAWGCDLRAVLQGYRSDTVSLSSRHAMDDSNVGTILLHALAKKKQGLTVSATSGFAPKNARQSYEKGLAAMRHNNPEKAQKNFIRAVDLYPRFAVAWFELGRIYELRAHTVEARDAYTKATTADASYVNPYERLYMLDLMEGRWQQAADASEKVLRLDPLNFSQAYYFNALANAHLKNLAAAEKSAREAAKLEGPTAKPRAHYLLGLVLAGKGDLTAAAENLRVFLKTAAEGPEEKFAKKILAMIESREAAQK
jgi:tetratricopeptide (TPR) repeat protein